MSISRHAVIPPAQDRGLSASSSPFLVTGETVRAEKSFQGEGEAESGIFQDYFVRHSKPVNCIGHFFSVGQGRVTLNLGQVTARLSRTNLVHERGFPSCSVSTTATNSHKYHETLTP